MMCAIKSVYPQITDSMLRYAIVRYILIWFIVIDWYILIPYMGPVALCGKHGSTSLRFQIFFLSQVLNLYDNWIFQIIFYSIKIWN